MKHNESSRFNSQNYFQGEPFNAKGYARATGQHHDHVAKRDPTPEQVGDLFEAASPDDRLKIVEHLIRPLGVMPLVTVADGVFAKIRFKGGWPALNIQRQDIAALRRRDVVQLAEYLQQEDERVLHGLMYRLPSSTSMH